MNVLMKTNSNLTDRVCIGICSLRTYYTQLFGAHPKYAHEKIALIQICKLLQTKEQPDRD
jgi:hypothetical protein